MNTPFPETVISTNPTLAAEERKKLERWAAGARPAPPSPKPLGDWRRQRMVLRDGGQNFWCLYCNGPMLPWREDGGCKTCGHKPTQRSP